MAKAKYSYSDKYPDHFVAIQCDACGYKHVMAVKDHPDFKGENGNQLQPVWGFNFNFDRPTFTPSLKVTSGIYVPWAQDWRKTIPVAEHEDYIKNSSICHSFITDGRIQFLSDCTHALAGKTVDLPDLL